MYLLLMWKVLKALKSAHSAVQLSGLASFTCRFVTVQSSNPQDPGTPELDKFEASCLQGDAGRQQVTNWLCHRETDACKQAAAPLPRGRALGPAFKPVDKQELDMQRMMASMQVRNVEGLVKMTSVYEMVAISAIKAADKQELDMQSMTARVQVRLSALWQRQLPVETPQRAAREAGTGSTS